MQYVIQYIRGTGYVLPHLDEEQMNDTNTLEYQYLR